MPGGEGQRGQGSREGLLTLPTQDCLGWGGPCWDHRAGAWQGWGRQMGPQRDTFGMDTDRATLCPMCDHFQEHSSMAGSPSGPAQPPAHMSGPGFWGSRGPRAFRGQGVWPPCLGELPRAG